jgi:hypothetical protein
MRSFVGFVAQQSSKPRRPQMPDAAGRCRYLERRRGWKTRSTARRTRQRVLRGWAATHISANTTGGQARSCLPVLNRLVRHFRPRSTSARASRAIKLRQTVEVLSEEVSRQKTALRWRKFGRQGSNEQAHQHTLRHETGTDTATRQRSRPSGLRHNALTLPPQGHGGAADKPRAPRPSCDLKLPRRWAEPQPRYGFET